MVRLAVVACFAIACGGKEPPTIAPGAPIPAAQELQLDTMQTECDAFVAALETWKKCPNIDDGEKSSVEGLIERAHIDFAAATKSQPEERAQKEIARRCRRATMSVKAATERCSNGKPPKQD